jgi:hypothetical protein
MICAIDCDLRTSYAVDEEGNAGRGANPEVALRALPHEAQHITTFLFEIASPVSFNRGAAGHAAMYQLAKWAIWNSACAATLALLIARGGGTLLVAPSDEWTRGFDLKTRHAMAKCKQPKKDLRECECMIFMFKHRPQAWKPLPEYLASL